jgi:hypothetical protein
MSTISILQVQIAVLCSVGHAMLCFAHYVEKKFHRSRLQGIMVLENVLAPMRIGAKSRYNRAILTGQQTLLIILPSTKSILSIFVLPLTKHFSNELS